MNEITMSIYSTGDATDIKPIEAGSNRISEEQIRHLYEGSHYALGALTAIRKLLSIESNPPIDEVIQSGVVPKIVRT